MFDIGWSELLVIGVVALVVIGPKELPGVLRTVGQMIGKLRRMAGEFQGQFQEALREAELDGLKKEFTGFAEDAHKSISGALPSNPLLDIENEVKAATASIEGRTPEAPAALESFPEPDVKLPEPPEPVEVTPAAIEAEIRSAAADLDGHASTMEAPAEPMPEAAAEPKPKRKPRAKAVDPAPAADEPEISEAVASLDNPPAEKPKRKPRVRAKAPAGPIEGEEGPGA